MAKRVWPPILHQAESWDAELDSWRDNLITALPLPEPSTGLFADLPNASQNDRGIAAINDPTAGWMAVISNGSAWERIPKRAAARADSTAANLAALIVDFNDLLAKLRTSGAIAP